MKTVRLTVAEALAKYLAAQKIVVDGKEEQLFGVAFAIFGHGNVTCFGQQLKNIEEKIPTWRGQNEQSMATAAIAYAKANKRQRIGIATSSIGPGATNMVTAAGIAHTNRLPLLLISGDAYVSRLPDPVLQQPENFEDPSVTSNDAFKPLTRYWDRVLSPAQLMHTLPQALDTMLDPATCGPVFLGLPQDVQGIAYDFPEIFFEEKCHRIRRPEPEMVVLEEAKEILIKAKKPLIISGGGVHYSLATDELAAFAAKHNIPVVETIAGRATMLQDNPLNAGPIGVTGSNSANHMANEADVVLAIGTRLQDFTTGSWSVFKNPEMQLISINVAKFDAIKHRSHPVIGDAETSMTKLSGLLADWRSGDEWSSKAKVEADEWKALVQRRTNPQAGELLEGTSSYAEVIGKLNRSMEEGDTVLTAAGGLPAELSMNWQNYQIGKFDIDFGYSCMGYEIAGGWGAKIANPDSDVVVLVGDGSYLIQNSDIYSSVLTGHKMIVVVCDNGGFAVINKLQNNTGNESFNNLLEDCRRPDGELARVDFAKHAEAQGAISEKLTSITDFDAAFARAKEADRTYVIVVDIDPVSPAAWSKCDCWWEVGLPEVTRNEETAKKVADWEEGRAAQRRGV
ncbi:3D-(3,5/4)-trihydroxycyclohexane-1,2-dione acylhydrolase (decyclizing) [Vibrio lentus]|uniref:3D-(3,5/4)-trihydroxycyclohexane-1,2-dione acylhydrolase (Decyclizing) n=1 Tax=Vibrio lentus TaxID=136468 RepID=A0AB36XRD8_9VIBR|nr:3D-(3,5/4)-trihydroxycyclohexane-1,2-dione acylhydrolase (decyclizing) [Vibrio lentus]MCC4839098.1 3D-(3,5/4)-trihydroxycyclohexane-1,2-dione acylhydrolase (decyclizing) [Vibrio lentus]PMI11387.1 3D-(3,5/4)-trihydroxycyclohexane-1,2-dione acylhydrolase (decyclizing) [Vibrio lentus]PMK37880.1 3D-(3,5/4)-trihydroxycyclohexane-1,2-dione acylhydrolase (decyclizing) [Vibrio lentus]PMK49390.1 3D-(3,5/4)-trihydroxycyclohexane-1,2-dione acylhydrolase (decyclizing) [Vibrio lentus]PML31979.1 3D-(3,5/